MKKTKSDGPKLLMSTQTLRNLSDDTLRGVAGGATCTVSCTYATGAASTVRCLLTTG